MARYLSLLHVLLAASIVGASQSSPIGKNNFTISGQLIYLSITACCCEFGWFASVLWTVRLGVKFGVVIALNFGPQIKVAFQMLLSKCFWHHTRLKGLWRLQKWIPFYLQMYEILKCTHNNRFWYILNQGKWICHWLHGESSQWPNPNRSSTGNDGWATSGEFHRGSKQPCICNDRDSNIWICYNFTTSKSSCRH